jgi:hypothetical protein
MIRNVNTRNLGQTRNELSSAIEVRSSLLNDLPRTRVREGARREVPTTHGLHIKRGGLCGVEGAPVALRTMELLC